MTAQPEQPAPNTSQWAILELMGHKTVAGLLTNEGLYGTTLLRVDVPSTTRTPAFTQYYSTQAVYCITLVSEPIARATAEQCDANALPVYVPELITLDQYRRDISQRDDTIAALQTKADALRQIVIGTRLLNEADDNSQQEQ